MLIRGMTVTLCLLGFSQQPLADEVFHESGCIAGQHAEYGLYKKEKRGRARVDFKTKFSNPPIVFLTPFWQNTDDPLRSIPRVVVSDTDHMEFNTNNAAGNFYVNWMAIDRGGKSCS